MLSRIETNRAHLITKRRRLGSSMIFRRALTLFAVVTISMLSAGAEETKPWPGGMVDLATLAPTIRIDMRYSGSRNFMGQRAPGYAAAKCILRREAAEALAIVERDLASTGYGLIVYDCYRPQRAVNAFLAWSQNPKIDDPSYHPELAKNRLFAEGYIARISSHSRGAAVDIGLVSLSSPTATSAAHEPVPCTSSDRNDRDPDMGTTFDCFDLKSWTKAKGLTEAQQRNRGILLHAMERRGFTNYAREWWHFEFRDINKMDVFDFTIE